MCTTKSANAVAGQQAEQVFISATAAMSAKIVYISHILNAQRCDVTVVKYRQSVVKKIFHSE
jgi:hypothetical protein